MSWIQEHDTTLPTYVDRFDPEALEPGVLHRTAVALLEDGASRAIRVPMLVARGAKPGPVVGITAAIHGNELNGIPTIHRLFKRIHPEHLSGTVAAALISNIPAYLANQRKYTDGQDLNRLFPGKPNGNEAQVYAHRLIDRIIQHFDVHLDLHTASFGRINSLYIRADMTDPKTARMARLAGAEIIVHNTGADGTLRSAAADLGIPSITVEIGDPQVFDPEMIRETRVGLRDIIEDLGLLAPDRETADGEAVECSRSFWLYTDTGGLLEVFPELTDRVTEGQNIARLLDPWGRLLRTYRAPCDGIVVGKSTNPCAQTGSRILHLGVVGAPTTPDAG